MLDESGLSVKGKTCNGYFTAMLGPGLLYDGMTPPFLPPCAWRNFDSVELDDPGGSRDLAYRMDGRKAVQDAETNHCSL